MIRNPSDLFDYFGASDERTLSRTLYKNTECGAWVSLFGPARRHVGTRQETWTVKVAQSIVGPVPVTARKAHCKKVYNSDIPRHVRDYLSLGDGHSIPLSWGELMDLEGKNGVVRITRISLFHAYVTFTVNVPVYKQHKGGAVFGSIVEGSDAEIQPMELLFPFTEETLEHAIQEIEDEADFLWKEANLDEALAS